MGGYMKNNITVIVVVFNLFFSTIVFNDSLITKSLSILSEQQIRIIEEHFSKDDDTDVRIISSHQLYDIENKPSYVMVIFNTGGYAILSKQSLVPSEYVMEKAKIPYSDALNFKKKIYLGAYNYYTLNDIESIQFENDSSILSINEELIDQIRQKNKSFLSITRTNTDTDERDLFKSSTILSTPSWQGRHQQYFIRYGGNSNYINYSPVQTSKWWVNDSKYYSILNHTTGICGTLSAAALLAYYDDYIDDKYIPNTIRSRSSIHPGNTSNQYSLVSSLFNYIDKNKNGTLPWQVRDGINNWRAVNSTNTIYQNRAISTVTAAPNTIISKIDTNRPILVGLLQSSSHDYGNHWVLAYQYKFYDFDWVEYKVVDNHGEHAAVINSNWTMGTVRLNN